MNSSKFPHHPTWWLLLLFMLLMVGLLILAHWLAQSPGWRIVLEIGVVLFIYGLFEAWVQLNSSALAQDRGERAYTKVTILETSPITNLPPSSNAFDEAQRENT